MKKIGIVTNSLYSSQTAYFAIRNVNEHLKKDYLTNFIFFLKDLTIPCVEPECGVMRWEELWGYDGHVITTDLEGTRKALLSPGSKSITYYMYDLDWMRRGRNTPAYEEFASLYQNDKVKLVARNDEYKALVEDIWNTKVAGVADDFDLEKIIPLIGVKDEKQLGDR